jgi:hypothetical protein
MTNSSSFRLTIADKEFELPVVPTLGIMRVVGQATSQAEKHTDPKLRDIEYVRQFLSGVLGVSLDWVDGLSLPEALRAIEEIARVWEQSGFFSKVKGQQSESQQPTA